PGHPGRPAAGDLPAAGGNQAAVPAAAVPYHPARRSAAPQAPPRARPLIRHRGASPGAGAGKRSVTGGEAEPILPGRRGESAGAGAPAAAGAPTPPGSPGPGGRPPRAPPAAPPTPMPIAVPSTSARFSDAEDRPSWPGGAFRSIISEIGA